MYSDAKKVIDFAGASPATLGLESQTQLETLVESWLVQIADYINRDRNRDFSAEEEVPPIIDNIALRMAVNMIRSAERQRTGSVVKFDATEDSLPVADARIFTDSIRRDLMRVPRKPAVRITRG